MEIENRDERFREVFLSILSHPEFYESIENYRARDELACIARGNLPRHWRIMRQGVWQHCIPPHLEHRVQGWKIHVSATILNAPEMLARVCGVCGSHEVAFKFACDTEMLSLLNSKRWHRGGSGKFITIYPSADTQFHVLMKCLAERLEGFEGPYILSDRRYEGCRVLYYRYGGMMSPERLTESGIRLPMLISPDGLDVVDERTPFYNPPSWVVDPYPDLEPEDDGALTLQNGRYVIKEALSFSNSGGVYRAWDRKNRRKVVIKEARPHTSTDQPGNDAVAMLQKEHRILSRIKDLKIAPEPFDLFCEWEHVYLVESFVRGTSLGRFSITENRLLSIAPSASDVQKWVSRIRSVGLRLAAVLDKLHSRGIVFGDLSPNNVMINPSDLMVRLIDLEGAYEIGVDKVAILYTPGFASRNRAGRTTVTFEDDYYALGSMLLYMMFPVNALMGIKPEANRVFLRSIERDMSVDPALADTILDLMDPDEKERPEPKTVARRLRHVDSLKAGPTLTTSPVSESSTCDLQKLLPRILSYVLSTADYKRGDRLFPGAVRTYNPLNVSYGATGIAYVLSKITGQVPKDVRDWIARQEIASNRYPPGLFVGLSGIAWVLFEIGESERAFTVYNQAQQHHLLYKSPELYCGVAGVGLASLYFWMQTRKDEYLDHAIQLGDWLDGTKTEDEMGYSWPVSGRKLVGYMRGSSGIALFLLYLYCASGQERYLSLGRKALAHDLGAAGRTAEGFLSFPEDEENTTLQYPYLAKGTAGVASVVLRYLVRAPEEGLAEQFAEMVPDVFRKYTIFPSLFNGLAGLGYFLLDCAQATSDVQYIQQAHKMLSGILLFAVEKDQGVAFPGDYLYRISTDLASGSSGIALFLHRLITNGPNLCFMLDSLLGRSANPEVELPLIPEEVKTLFPSQFGMKVHI